jgi:chromosome segregation ATPase
MALTNQITDLNQQIKDLTKTNQELQTGLDDKAKELRICKEKFNKQENELKELKELNKPKNEPKLNKTDNFWNTFGSFWNFNQEGSHLS